MKELMDLRNKRTNLWNSMKAFLDAHRGNDGCLSAEDGATYDKMEADLDNLGKEIARMERLEAINAEMEKPVNAPIVNKPGAAPQAEDEATGKASKAYSTNFWKAMRNRVVPPEVRNDLQVGTSTEGGYLVPDEFERQLIMGLEEENVFRKIAHTIRTSSGDRKIPVVTSHGQAYWIDEEAAFTASDDAFGQVTLNAYKVGALIKVSEELLHDSAFDLPSYISREFARRVGAAEEAEFVAGTSSGRPTGVLSDAEQGVVAAAPNKITFDEIMDLYYSLKAPYRRKAVFLMQDATVKELRKVKLGTGEYIWHPSVSDNAPDTILNRPVYTSSYMPALTTGNKSVLFGDFGYYWIADREARTFKRLDELYAVTGQVGFIGYERVDGKLVLAEAMKYLKQA